MTVLTFCDLCDAFEEKCVICGWELRWCKPSRVRLLVLSPPAPLPTTLWLLPELSTVFAIEFKFMLRFKFCGWWWFSCCCGWLLSCSRATDLSIVSRLFWLRSRRPPPPPPPSVSDSRNRILLPSSSERAPPRPRNFCVLLIRPPVKRAICKPEADKQDSVKERFYNA